jgi:uncharacterized protein (DUF1330 family)
MAVCVWNHAGMALTLAVLLWPHPGEDDALGAYEDEVLALLPDHGGRVVSRVRRQTDGDGPLEVQIIDLRDEAALDSYMADPRRTRLTEIRDRAIARTDVIRVDHV